MTTPAGHPDTPVPFPLNEGRTIHFANPLPAMSLDPASGHDTGTYNNWEIACPGLMTTRDPDLGIMLYQLRKCIRDDRRLVFVDGRVLTCSLNWIRDHVHQSKGFCHWEHDMRSFFDFILDTQRADGQFYELLKQEDDCHWQLVTPDCVVKYPADNQTLVRLELEADIEYLMVEGALQIWRVEGDDEWLRRALPRLEKGIGYITSDPKRWDAARGLAKRPFTIDTWDFVHEPPRPYERKIMPDSPMSIMHGDNSGLCQAMMQLAFMNERFGNDARAEEWRGRAAAVRDNMMKHLWNGTFFRHQLHLGHKGLDDLEAERLSLSNAYALNRGLLSRTECRAIIGEYMRRRRTSGCFAEWFSIDPPYAGGFCSNKPGHYVNGGISPFTAGELAKGAFRNGFEEYGWDIVRRLMEMMKRDGTIYFLYTPDEAKPMGGGPSGWGAAALLSAIDQGLAGIVDAACRYAEIDFAPRWPVTDYTELRYVTGYERSRAFVDCRYVLADAGMRYRLQSPAVRVNAHLLLPKGRDCRKLLVNGAETPFKVVKVGSSRYVDASVGARGVVDFEALFG